MLPRHRHLSRSPSAPGIGPRKSKSITKLEVPSVSSAALTRDSSPSHSSLLSRKRERFAKSITVFKHDHYTYLTCFGAVHVKATTCFVGFNVLIGICCSLLYCVFTSQEQRRPGLKLFLIPLAAVIVCLLCLFVGVIQQKAKLLYPFIAFQVFIAFATAISMGMIAISVACNTKYILRLIVDVNLDEMVYKRSALTIFSVLSFTLCVQIWYLRTVCNCFRYYVDFQRFKDRMIQGAYV
ncbi:hypothetical protein Aduo_008078 [Ancylostoma duodenale]